MWLYAMHFSRCGRRFASIPTHLVVTVPPQSSFIRKTTVGSPKNSVVVRTIPRSSLRSWVQHYQETEEV